jgi:TetR/AcrR family transcriptional regulator
MEKVRARRPGAPLRAERVRREDILAQAEQLFSERGYEGASMADLAESVGLRKASLFHHFHTKDALYAEVLGSMLAGAGQALAQAVGEEGSFHERFDRLTVGLIQLFGARPNVARLLLREMLEHGAARDRSISINVTELLTAAVTFVRLGQEAKAFRADTKAEHLVLSILGAFFLPFATLDQSLALMDDAPSPEAFLQARLDAVRHQMRLMVFTA